MKNNLILCALLMPISVVATVELEVMVEYKDIITSTQFTKKIELANEESYLLEHEDATYAIIALKNEMPNLAEFSLDNIGHNEFKIVSDSTMQVHYGEESSRTYCASGYKFFISLLCKRKD